MEMETLGKPTDADAGSHGFDSGISSTSQFLIFQVEEEFFAVDLAPVQEIIRMPQLVRVPLAPPALDGLANLRGQILPIISLRRMFGFPGKDSSDSTRAVVIDFGQPMGFVVDRVASVVEVETSRIETSETVSNTVDSDLLAGLVRDMGGHPIVMVVDFAKLVAREFAISSAVNRKTKAVVGFSGTTTNQNQIEEISDERQLVSFEVCQQEYAIPIEEVQEIVQVPASIFHVPRSQEHVLGLMTLRSRILPLVNLRRIFGLADRATDEKSRIIVLSLGSASVGVVVDGVREVLRIWPSEIDTIPPLVARDGTLAEIIGICRLESGKRLVSIVSAAKLFDHSSVQEALTNVKSNNPSDGADDTEGENGIDEVEQMVVFRLDKEEFGVPIASIQEIVRVPDEMTRVVEAPAYVEGVINLRGTVLPVVDLRTRMGLAKAERSDRQRIMVFLMRGTRTGFVVDQVAEVLRVPKNSIEPAPHLSSEQGLLSRMANLEKEKRMIQLMDPALLFESRKLDELASLT